MTFFERLSHHARAHLAPAGATLDGAANAVADTFSLSMKNHITLDWLRLLDPRLLDIVQTEYGIELKSGTQLAALVPKIAHNLDSLLKRHSKSNGNGESINLVKEEYSDDTSESSETILYLHSSGNWVGADSHAVEGTVATPGDSIVEADLLPPMMVDLLSPMMADLLSPMMCKSLDIVPIAKLLELSLD